jgi:C4-dicarboxylate-binding protein DctP
MPVGLTRRTLFGALGASCITTKAQSQQVRKPIRLRLSHVVTPDTPKGKGALKFKQLAEVYSGGAVQVEVFPNSELYQDRDEIEALQLGSVEMIIPSLAKFAPLGTYDFEVFDLPFIIRRKEIMSQLIDTPLGQHLFSSLKKRGVLGLAFWDNGFKVITSNTPIRSPFDLRGMAVRIQPSTVLEAQMHALGAVPRTTRLSEVYSLLKAGLIEATENTPSNVYTQGIHLLQKYLTLSYHGYLGYAVLVSEAFWMALDPTLRRQLTRALTEATEFTNRIAEDENASCVDQIRASGASEIIELTKGERLAWQEALSSNYELLAPRIEPKFIRQFRDFAG